MVNKLPDERDAGASYEAKLTANWKAGKAKAVEAAKNSGKTRAGNVERDFKIHLMVGALNAVTTIALFVIVFWNELPLLDVLFG